jgi:hypothetical protein
MRGNHCHLFRPPVEQLNAPLVDGEVGLGFSDEISPALTLVRPNSCDENRV